MKTYIGTLAARMNADKRREEFDTTSAGTGSEQSVIDEDVKTLHSLGYAQELMRRMSGFSNFAISMSIICILAGCVTSFHLAFCGAGGAAVGLGWPLGCVFALCVAATMAQVASAFPSAGGVYHWASMLGGKGWGWITAWCILAGLILILSAVNVGVYNFTTGAFGITVGEHPQVVRFLVVLAIACSQAVFNYRGIRLTTLLTDFSGYLILAIASVLTVAMLFASHGFPIARLVTFTNFSGSGPDPAHPVWQKMDSIAWLFVLGLLLPAYTIAGYDASANTSEETVGAARTVPRAILRSVLVSTVFGWVMLAAAVLAIPSMTTAADQGGDVFPWIMRQALSRPMYLVLSTGIAVTQYLCSLAALTSASRMAYAFARDGGLPQVMRHVSPKFSTPSVAIWVTATIGVAFTLVPKYDTISAACSIFVYIAYVIPAAVGLFAYGRTWTKMGPWDVGGWYRVLAVLSVVGCLVIIVIGVAPPNDLNRWIVGGPLALLTIVWFAFERHRFQGPPTGHAIEDRQAEIAEREQRSHIIEHIHDESVH